MNLYTLSHRGAIAGLIIFYLAKLLAILYLEWRFPDIKGSIFTSWMLLENKHFALTYTITGIFLFLSGLTGIIFYLINFYLRIKRHTITIWSFLMLLPYLPILIFVSLVILVVIKTFI